jgi:hypothetical protein
MAELIGPLTAEEWCSLRLGTDDDPFQCCAETSALRDAAFHALRMGGEEYHGTAFYIAWLRVTESHPDHRLAEHPIVGKLYQYYVEGKEPLAEATVIMRTVRSLPAPSAPAGEG